MNKPVFRLRLGVQLLSALLLSLGLALLAFWGLNRGLYSLLDRATGTAAFQIRQQNAAARRLQAYVTDKGLSLSDCAALGHWVEKEKYVFLVLVKDGRVLYDSTYPDQAILTDAVVDSQYTDWKSFLEINFSDGTAKADITSYSEFRFYSAASRLSGVLSFFLFLAVLMGFLHYKLRYVALLEQELHILEGGDLEHPVTVRGQDELGDLAQGIDDMRRSIIERQASEDQARSANHQLITAMSHDLRTPLTALIGYLEILELHKYGDEEQLGRFIHSSREKAYQIKAMSDKLFEYFLVYGKDEEELEFEEADAPELFQQVLGESLFSLESRGFRVECDFPEIQGRVRISPDLLRRVFDNLFSNLVKYADPAQPVRAGYHIGQGRLMIAFSNGLAPGNAAESTRIGLKTCSKIMLLHQGGFSAGPVDGGRFESVLWLPLV